MTAETLAPAVDAVFLGDAARDDEFVVAVCADVVVASVAFEAVVASVGGRDRVSTDVAKSCKGEGAEDGVCDFEVAGAAQQGGRLWCQGWCCGCGVAVWWSESGVLTGRRWCRWHAVADGWGFFSELASNGDERVCAMPSLVDTVVAKTPIAIIAIVAFPVACIGKGLASVAKDAAFQAFLWIVFASEYMWRDRRFCEWCGWSAIPVSNEYMRLLVVWWVAIFGCLLLVSSPCCPTKAKPVLATLSLTITTDAYVERAIIAPCTIVVELILDMIFVTTLAGQVWLRIQGRCAGSRVRRGAGKRRR